MKKVDCCGNCEYFNSNNDKLGICTNYDSDRIGYLLNAKHYCFNYKLAIKPFDTTKKENWE